MKKLLSIFAFSLLAFPAKAEIIPFAEVPGWTISIATDDKGNDPLCMSYTGYKSGIGLGFVFSASGISMYFSEIDYKREYDVLFTDDKGRTFRMLGRPDSDGNRMVMFDNLSTNFIEAVMATRYLNVEGFERNLSMRGSKAMIEKGFECFLSVSSGRKIEPAKPAFDNVTKGKTAL